eukprot:Partr_v1_DN25233_c0_g1_i1_m16503 putative holocarboxylase synthetase (biotin-(proprionyl-CoA-carboxylase (ATP-hydrolysing)) ligase)
MSRMIMLLTREKSMLERWWTRLCLLRSASVTEDPIEFRDALNIFRIHRESATQIPVALTTDNEKICDIQLQNSSTHPILHEFNFTQYYDELSRLGCSSMGSTILYADQVSSTQTILERNPQFLSLIDHGTVFTSHVQTEGRGRSGNRWLNSRGCLQFSLVLKRPVDSGMVFMQYLMSIAIAQSLGDNRIFIKWPNDIYATTSPGDLKNVRKMGGVLVNSSVGGRDSSIVIGCGVNIVNSVPSDFVNYESVAGSGSCPGLDILLARILVRFEALYNRFEQSRDFVGDDMLGGEYLRLWLHSNQRIQVLLDDRPVDAIVTGLTSSGYLRAVDSNDPAVVFELFPDGSSFDLSTGMVARKIERF